MFYTKAQTTIYQVLEKFPKHVYARICCTAW